MLKLLTFVCCEEIQITKLENDETVILKADSDILYTATLDLMKNATKAENRFCFEDSAKSKIDTFVVTELHIGKVEINHDNTRYMLANEINLVELVEGELTLENSNKSLLTYASLDLKSISNYKYKLMTVDKNDKDNKEVAKYQHFEQTTAFQLLFKNGIKINKKNDLFSINKDDLEKYYVKSMDLDYSFNFSDDNVLNWIISGKTEMFLVVNKDEFEKKFKDEFKEKLVSKVTFKLKGGAKLKLKGKTDVTIIKEDVKKEEEKKGLGMKAIIGIVCGAVGGALIIGLIIYLYYSKKLDKNDRITTNDV